MFGETGILGLAAFLLVLFRIGKVFAQAFPLTKNFTGLELCYIVGIIGGTIGILASSFLIDLFEASKFATVFWLLIGCAVVLVKSKEYAD
jgi:uncharacterized membrane protein YeaQ/YmgE (transglycosylase-associated protein family)